MAIRTINLNLVPILQALLKEESVVKAAAQVGLSQPAMSGALARLREILDDPLLVRVGRSMRLTPRAQRMRKQLDQICAQIDVLFEAERFDPSTAVHSFVVALPDYLELLLSGVLLRRLRDVAPRIRIEFVGVPGDLPEWIEDGRIDLAVCGSFSYWPDMKYECLFKDRIVAAVSKDHPLIGKSHVTSADLAKFPGLHFNTSVPSGARNTTFITGLPSLDWASQINSGQFVNVVLLAAAPPVVGRAPVSLVERLAGLLPLASIELADEKTEFETGMFWTQIQDEAQEHKWLRAIVRECLLPLGAPPK